MEKSAGTWTYRSSVQKGFTFRYKVKPDIYGGVEVLLYPEAGASKDVTILVFKSGDIPSWLEKDSKEKICAEIDSIMFLIRHGYPKGVEW